MKRADPRAKLSALTLKRARKAARELPFKGDDGVAAKRQTMKNRQRRWMLDGLKHLGAPIVTCMSSSNCPESQLSILYLPTYLSAYLSIYIAIYLSIYLSIDRSIYV